MQKQWMMEPNEKIFYFRKYKCAILRNPEWGFLCGYVGIPKGHLFYKKFYEKIDVECHGGLTFSDFFGGGFYRNYGKGLDDGLWYIGFDCCHLGDFSPFRKTFQSLNLIADAYRDMDYVTNQCKNIVRQVIARESRRKKKKKNEPQKSS